jgi:purine-cytosine permease-like protein
MKKNSAKIDKGFCWSYWRLSYRRKMLRSLWLGVATVLFFLFFSNWTIFGLKRNFVILLIFAMWGAQALYNYYMWKRKETHNSNKPTDVEKRIID